MGLREVGAKLTLDGEAQWKAQMNAVDRQLKNVKAELVANTSAFNGHANSTEALTARGKLLGEQLEQQKVKVLALEEAVASASELYGENSVQADKLRQSLQYAVAAEHKMEDSVRDNNACLDEASASADGCATSIDGYGKQVKVASEESGGLMGQLTKLAPGLDLTAIKGTLTGAALAGAFKKAWDWAMQVVESTKELRAGLAKLETSAAQAGVSFDSGLNDSLRSLYEMTGDYDSSMEALSNLLAADYSTSGLTDIIEQLSGAVVRFPDTLKIESLADSLKETLATGKGTGQFAELLGRLGINEATFAAALADCTTQAQKQDLVLQMLAGAGLAELNTSYKGATASSVALADAQYDLDMANADLGASLEPLAAEWTRLKASAAGYLAELVRARLLGYSTAEFVRLADSVGMTTDALADLMTANGLGFAEVGTAAMAAATGMDEYIEQLACVAPEASAAEEATADYTGMLAQNSETVDSAVERLDALKASYDDIRAGIDNVVGGFAAFDNEAIAGAQNVDGMSDALSSQIEYLNDYTANLQAAAELGLSQGLIDALSDGSVESAELLAAIVADQGATVDEINIKWAQVEEGKKAFTDSVAELTLGFSSQLTEIQSELDAAVDAWNMYDEAAGAGTNTVAGFVSGVRAQIGTVQAVATELANAYHAAYAAADDQHSPSRRSYAEARNTALGGINAIRDSVAEMQRAGREMAAAYHSGYAMASGARTGRAELAATINPSGAYGRAQTSAGGSVVNNFYPQQMDAGMTDYLINRLNAELGAKL